MLGEIAAIQAERERLDERELGLIERARLAGATWTAIGQALGGASRQAAQQRHQRLVAALRSQRRRADLEYAADLAALRDTLADLERWIAVDRVWDRRFPRAALVRATVAIALEAQPGALFSLAVHVAADLAGADLADADRADADRAGSGELPAPARDALARCQRLIDVRPKS